MKKIFISLVSLLVFTSCVLHVYSFTSTNYNNDKISIKANLVDEQKENSPLNYIYIYDKKSNATNHHEIKILSSTIKIVCKDKEYIIKNSCTLVFQRFLPQLSLVLFLKVYRILGC